MTHLFRLLALSLLLGLALPTVANEKIGKDELDAQKEVLQLKIDNGRELVEKSLDGFKGRIDALDKRIDDQNNRLIAATPNRPSEDQALPLAKAGV